jgi:hypothetical protein
VPEPLHQVLDRGARQPGECLTGVPQVVEGEPLHADPLAGPGERLADRVAPHWVPGAVDEHPLRARPRGHVLDEDREHVWRHVDCPAAGFRLRLLVERNRRLEQLHPVAPDGDDAGLQVDVLAMQREHFATTDAAPRSEQDGGPVAGGDRSRAPNVHRTPGN